MSEFTFEDVAGMDEKEAGESGVTIVQKDLVNLRTLLNELNRLKNPRKDLTTKINPWLSRFGDSSIDQSQLRALVVECTKAVKQVKHRNKHQPFSLGLFDEEAIFAMCE